MLLLCCWAQLLWIEEGEGGYCEMLIPVFIMTDVYFGNGSTVKKRLV